MLTCGTPWPYWNSAPDGDVCRQAADSVSCAACCEVLARLRAGSSGVDPGGAPLLLGDAGATCFRARTVPLTPGMHPHRRYPAAVMLLQVKVATTPPACLQRLGHHDARFHRPLGRWAPVRDLEHYGEECQRQHIRQHPSNGYTHHFNSCHKMAYSGHEPANPPRHRMACAGIGGCRLPDPVLMLQLKTLGSGSLPLIGHLTYSARL